MAIVLEEEKNKTNIVSIITWLAVLGIIVAAVYYIFFNQPQLVEVAAPANFQNVDPLSKIKLNPEDVINSQSFQSLKQYVAPPVPGNAGRDNPFVPVQ
ncbi:MAG: hypothetical protein KGJ89_00695 [Patescibacteria group bacterium]|nr:hypothetical protein [Patescibacteria group bacterium]MDE2015032.1 hypothetical protein [Patescibacteria group bacterium]MDE2226460.1 hypothetical protein [Patescibacteria group bacterium]